MHVTGIKTDMQRVDERPRLLLKIETSEGISGWSECYNHGPDWGIEIDEQVLKKDDYVHWERKVTRKPDGATAYP